MGIKCEYPLYKKKSKSSSSLTRLPPASQPDIYAGLPMNSAPLDEEAIRAALTCVLQEQEIMIGQDYYYVEMFTDGHVLAISARKPHESECLEVLVNEESHLRFVQDFQGDYSQVALRLRIEGGQLVI